MSSARLIAARALGGAAAAYPDLHPIPLKTRGLEPRDAALAEAILAAAMQRWITLEYLLDRHLKQPMRKLEPKLRGVLLSGAAQLLVLDRLPVSAVVDETVSLARSLVRPRAAGLVNAVLRRVASDISRIDLDTPWTPAADRLPYEQGSILLSGDLLPKPDKMDLYLSVATSHPRPLVRRWLDSHGDEAIAMCAHGACEPPVFVIEDGNATRWQGDDLVRYLAEHPGARVQDPTAALAVEATRGLSPRKVLDYCAGRGTKTRQVATLHGDAEVVATDVNDERLSQLRDVPDNVRAVPMDDLVDTDFDLVMLDVPCTNTGTLARRLEARYRFSQSTLDQLVNLQRAIVDVAPSMMTPGGYLLYSTCSIEVEENRKQAARAADICAGPIAAEQLTLPGGRGDAYHDGGYFALIGPCALT